MNFVYGIVVGASVVAVIAVGIGYYVVSRVGKGLMDIIFR